MRLIKVHIRPVLFAHRHYIPQIAILTLHRIDPLHDDQDPIPRPPRTRLSVNNCLPQDLLQIVRVIVTKRPDGRSRRPCTIHNARVIQFVAHNEIPPRSQRGDNGGIGIKPHVQHHGILLTAKVGHDLLHLAMQRGGAELQPARSNRRRKRGQTSHDVFTTGNIPIVRKAQIIIRSEIETLANHSSIGCFVVMLPRLVLDGALFIVQI
mmetsp:Transcript_29462/g.62545  ORF Transcript_29462/g.62545 Transcript_29462/m.62545 type:complete len:208 (+) Transcript_29462:761-1384(+)